MTLAYDGTNFYGWQRQNEFRTVEGEVRKALEKMHKHPVSLNAAGRTDTGVHANGQVINFKTDLLSVPPERWPRALNSFMPLDVRAKFACEVDDGFHARHDARERSYKYFIFASDVPEPHYRLYSHRVTHKPKLQNLARLAQVFIGEHDFTTLSSPSDQIDNYKRLVLGASFYVEGPFIVYHVRAVSFLWKMVRTMVGTLLEFEKNGRSPEELKDKLEAKDRSLAGETAPPWGLFLDRVGYKGDQLYHGPRN